MNILLLPDYIIEILCHSHHMNDPHNYGMQSKVAMIRNWQIIHIRRFEDNSLAIFQGVYKYE